MGTVESGGTKIKLKGKYLVPLKEFVDSLNFNNDLWIEDDAKLNALVEMVCRLHSDFITAEDVTHLILREQFAFNRETQFESGALSDEKNAAVRQVFLTSLKTQIESLPRTYTVRFEIPGLRIDQPYRFEISDGVAIVTGAPMKLFEVDDVSGADVNHSAYYECRVLGYLRPHARSPGLGNAISAVKQANFMLKSSGMFDESSLSRVVQASITTEGSAEARTLKLTHALGFCLGTVAPNMPRLLTHEFPTVVSPGGPEDGIFSSTKIISRMAQSDDEILTALTENLRPVQCFLARADDPDFASIGAAIEWYEDSRSAENQTFAYLAACIGLEAILGSDEVMTGMSKRLADRYAFLLGVRRGERSALAKDYEEVLNIRGKLVHAKAARLKPEESALLSKARAMLKRVIQFEVSKISSN